MIVVQRPNILPENRDEGYKHASSKIHNLRGLELECLWKQEPGRVFRAKKLAMLVRNTQYARYSAAAFIQPKQR